MAEENQTAPPEQAAPQGERSPAPVAGGSAPAGVPTAPKGGSKTLIILVVIALVLATAAAGYFYWQTTQTSEESGVAATTTASAVVSPSTNRTTSGTGGVASPTASTQPTATEQQPIVVTSPTANQLVTSPVLVTGTAIAFESTINARIKDANGEILDQVTIMTEAPDAGLPGKYSANLTFSSPTTDSGTVEVFENDAATGAEVNKITVQVRFR